MKKNKFKSKQKIFSQVLLICFCISFLLIRILSASDNILKLEPDKNTMQKTNAILIPLDPKLWKQLKFTKIRPNTISGNKDQLVLDVDQSSSPLVYKLDQVLKFKAILVEGEILDGQLNLPLGQKQGLFKNKKSVTDDYVLRFGLVLKGKNKKPPVPGFLLASWIKEMFKLAPSGVGVDVIYFLKVANRPEDVGETRNHPLSDYLYEEAVTSAETGPFKIEKSFEPKKEILGFWISANGEGTKSKFKTKITKIELRL